MNKRILLISIMLYRQYPNAGVDHIAGYLRSEGYNVDIAYFHDDNPVEEIKAGLSYDYDYYGFSVDIKNVDKCIELADYIKDKTGAAIWFGGAYVACCYKELFNDCKGVDYIILGGGEAPLMYLLEHESSEDRDGHPHIATRTSVEGKCYNENKLLDYKSAEDYFIRYPASRGFYTYCIMTKNNTCGGSCTFCINWCIERERNKFYFRSNETILEEIKHMYYTYQISHFFFIDDDIFDPDTREGKNRIADLCRLIIESGLQITMTGYTKANALSDCPEDEQLLELMYKAGFVSIFVGIESGSQRDLELFHKQANVDDNRVVLPLLYKHKIKPEYEMITFHPYATLDTLRENYLFLKDVKSYNFRHYSMTEVSIYKNTELWRQTVADGLLTENYSYKNPGSYNYRNSDVAYMAQFVKKHFELNNEISNLVTADQLVTYFYRFSHYSDSVGLLAPEVKKIAKDNYELMIDTFEPLYINNDYDLCEKRYENFVKEYKNQADKIQIVINKMLKYSIVDSI